jgi:hypothetical protein
MDDKRTRYLVGYFYEGGKGAACVSFAHNPPTDKDILECSKELAKEADSKGAAIFCFQRLSADTEA